LRQVLTLYQGKMTTGRRSSPIPQLKCVGGSAQGMFNPEVREYFKQSSGSANISYGSGSTDPPDLGGQLITDLDLTWTFLWH
jgi:hypothetical protein